METPGPDRLRALFRLVCTAALLAAPAGWGICAPAFAAPPAETGARLQRVDLEHFTLWSERELSDADVFATRQDLQNVRREVGRAFGGFFPRQKFDVMLTQEDTFRSYSGTPQHVRGLFDGTIHLPVASGADPVKLKAILYHEYTHALLWLASEGKCPSWVHEGFAVEQEERVEPKRALDREALLEGGRLRVPLTELENRVNPLTGDPGDVRTAYLEAFAVARYLRSRYSSSDILRWVRAIAKTGSWERAALDTLKLSAERMERETAAWVAAG